MLPQLGASTSEAAAGSTGPIKADVPLTMTACCSASQQQPDSAVSLLEASQHWQSGPDRVPHLLESCQQSHSAATGLGDAADLSSGMPNSDSAKPACLGNPAPAGDGLTGGGGVGQADQGRGRTRKGKGKRKGRAEGQQSDATAVSYANGDADANGTKQARPDLDNSMAQIQR